MEEVKPIVVKGVYSPEAYREALIITNPHRHDKTL